MFSLRSLEKLQIVFLQHKSATNIISFVFYSFIIEYFIQLLFIYFLFINYFSPIRRPFRHFTDSRNFRVISMRFAVCGFLMLFCVVFIGSFIGISVRFCGMQTFLTPRLCLEFTENSDQWALRKFRKSPLPEAWFLAFWLWSRMSLTTNRFQLYPYTLVADCARLQLDKRFTSPKVSMRIIFVKFIVPWRI